MSVVDVQKIKLLTLEFLVFLCSVSLVPVEANLFPKLTSKRHENEAKFQHMSKIKSASEPLNNESQYGESKLS